MINLLLTLGGFGLLKGTFLTLFVKGNDQPQRNWSRQDAGSGVVAWSTEQEASLPEHSCMNKWLKSVLNASDRSGTIHGSSTNQYLKEYRQ